MSTPRISEAPPSGSGPPLGSWPKFYALTGFVGALYIALLYWFTATFNQTGGGS